MPTQPQTHHAKRRGEAPWPQPGEHTSPTKRQRADAPACNADLFEDLPDELVLSIVARLVSQTASSGVDLVSLALTCRRFRALAKDPQVLAGASLNVLALAATAGRWSLSAHNFLRSCADAGNLEACYILGMILFYCFSDRSGAALIVRAALGSHAAALYALAIIQFNGSGGTKNDRDLRAGVALCAKAALLGHVDAMRELGHCLKDGYGVRRSVVEGRRFLMRANVLEVAAAAGPRGRRWRASLPRAPLASCPIMSDCGYAVPPAELHAAHRFMVEWAGARREAGPLRVCSHARCGRVETRPHEFRRCSVCGAVNYCSRACQALDWKMGHKAKCVPAPMDGQDAAAGQMEVVDQ